MPKNARERIRDEIIERLETDLKGTTSAIYPTYFRVDPGPGGALGAWVIGFSLETKRFGSVLLDPVDRTQRFLNLMEEVNEWAAGTSPVWPLEEVRELAVD